MSATISAGKSIMGDIPMLTWSRTTDVYKDQMAEAKEAKKAKMEADKVNTTDVVDAAGKGKGKRKEGKVGKGTRALRRTKIRP